MKVYTYNANGLLTGEESINGDIVPIGATAIAPPQVPQGRMAIFDGVRWITPDKATWLDTVVRPERNSRLDAADQRVRRYDYQLRAGLTPKESAEKINELLTYMQKLRDLPNSENLMPDNLKFPDVP